jgi:ribose 5-phosphate isomerase A
MTSPAPVSALTQDELKAQVGRAALDYVVKGEIVGVGTGSTVNKFIDALAGIKDQIRGAVSSSLASTERLRALGIAVFDSNEVEELAVYIDGADEIDGRGFMIKGGGAALTREKIVAAQSRRFVCIADESKQVDVLGNFPVPVEVIPMAVQRLVRQFAAMGGTARVRLKDGRAVMTDNGQQILDVTGLRIADPLGFEIEVNQWPGVVTVGVFAHQKAAVCLLCTAGGVKTLANRAAPRGRSRPAQLAAPAPAPARPPAGWPARACSSRAAATSWDSRQHPGTGPIRLPKSRAAAVRRWSGAAGRPHRWSGASRPRCRHCW